MGFYGPTVVSWERYYWYLVSWGVKHFVIYCCDRAALINPIPSTCVCMCVCARFMVCGLLRPIVLPWRRYVNILFVPHCPWVCLILLAFRKRNQLVLLVYTDRCNEGDQGTEWNPWGREHSFPFFPEERFEIKYITFLWIIICGPDIPGALLGLLWLCQV